MSENEKAEDTLPAPVTQRNHRKWRSFFGGKSDMSDPTKREDRDDDHALPTKWSMGILNDTKTNEVPGIS